LEEQIQQSEVLTLEKVKQDFTQFTHCYFSTVVYTDNGQFFDLYINANKKDLSQDQIDVYNSLNNNIDSILLEINSYLKCTLTNSEQNKAIELNSKQLYLAVLEIQDNTKNYDAVLICGKQYSYFKIFKRDIGIRIEFKNGQIISMLRKKDTTIEN